MTTTTFAILGLLAVKPWTTYELIQQVERSLGRIWPRAQSKLYEEPKKLVDQGFARASVEQVGRRRRTLYTITPKGRRALAAWLTEPGAGPVMECEALLKVHFADSGTRQDLLATLDSVRQWVRERNEQNVETGRAYVTGQGAFPEREAVIALVGRFLTDYYVMVADWAEWASGVVADWPDEPRHAPPDPAAQAESLRRAEALAARFAGGGTAPFV